MIWRFLMMSALFLMPALARAEGEAQPIIEGFRFVGLKRVDNDVITRALKSKKGAPLDVAKVSEDVRAIFATNLFRDVVVRRMPSPRDPKKVMLIYEVQEKPSIRRLDYEGTDELSKDDFKEVVDVKLGSILNIDQLAKNVGKIKEKYVDKGFYLAEVRYKITNVNADEVDVAFVVNENHKVQVRKITFLGNKNVPDEDLKAMMATREGNFLSFLTSSGTYKEEAFQADLYRLTSVYFDRGYINAKVLKPQVQISADRRYIYITIPIEEGLQFNVGEFDFSGDLWLKDAAGNVLVSPDDVRKRVSVKRGEVFNRSQLFADLQRAADLYRDQGYAYANVTPNTRIDSDKRIVDVKLEVERGDKVYFEKIEVSGNTKTRDKVIRRELRIYEGELFNATAIEISKARVTALGYFEKVDITTERGSAADRMNVKVEIKEKATGTFQVGAGFSSLERFIFTAQIAQQNFLGRSQNIALQAQLSFGQYGRQIITANFIEPYLLDTNLSLNLNGYYTEQRFNDFQRLRRGGSVGLGYPLDDYGYWRLFGTYTLEYIDVGNTSGLFATPSTRELYNLNQKGFISSLRADLQYDTRDNRLFPSKGAFHTLSVEFADKVIGSSFNFLRLTGNLRYYQPIIAGVVFKTNAQAGWIFSRDPRGVPISERYFLGGIYSIRGYRPLSVGPMISVPNYSSDPTSASSNFVLGGDKQFQLNLELEFPVLEKAGIRGVLFSDMGNAFNDDVNFFYIGAPANKVPYTYLIGSNTPMKPFLGLLYSVGAGIRWFSPIGPLRFEFGVPITKVLSIDRDFIFEFTIGNFF